MNDHGEAWVRVAVSEGGHPIVVPVWAYHESWADTAHYGDPAVTYVTPDAVDPLPPVG